MADTVNLVTTNPVEQNTVSVTMAVPPSQTFLDAVLTVVRDELDHYTNDNFLVMEGIVKDALNEKLPTVDTISGEVARLEAYVPAEDRRYVNLGLILLGVLITCVLVLAGNTTAWWTGLVISAVGVEAKLP